MVRLPALTDACAACKCFIAISAALVFIFSSVTAWLYNFVFATEIAANCFNVFFAVFSFFAAASAAAFFSASIFLAASICAWVGFGGAAIATVGTSAVINSAAIIFFIS